MILDRVQFPLVRAFRFIVALTTYIIRDLGRWNLLTPFFFPEFFLTFSHPPLLFSLILPIYLHYNHDKNIWELPFWNKQFDCWWYNSRNSFQRPIHPVVRLMPGIATRVISLTTAEGTTVYLKILLLSHTLFWRALFLFNS